MLCEFMHHKSFCVKFPIFVTTLKGLIVGNLEFRPAPEIILFLGEKCHWFDRICRFYQQWGGRSR